MSDGVALWYALSVAGAFLLVVLVGRADRRKKNVAFTMADRDNRISDVKIDPIEWSGDPTPEMLASAEFEAVWQCIKSWDINVPGVYRGYCRATGSHVRAILDALARSK